MAQKLIDKLRPASFRGVSFQVDRTEFETGRRTQVHEYPQRDKPYSQDMGRATRRLSFDAFIVGQDYVERADQLLDAMEKPGSGALVHPWFGSLNVNVLGCRVEFDRGLGLARFSLSFVESGELAFPSSSPSTASLSRAAASGLEAASVAAFAKVFAAAGYINNVTTQAISTYGRVLYFLSNPAFALSNALGFGGLPSNLNSLSSLFGAPVTLGWSFASLLNLSAKAKSGAITSSDSTTIPLVRGLTRMATDPALATPAAKTYTTVTSAQIAANNAAILGNTRQLLLVQACGIASYLTAAIYDDIMALKNELAAALDAETLTAMDDDLYQALMAARAAMFTDLTERSRNSARLTSFTPPDVLPMLVIAYDYYEDAGRDLEIVARNKIRNPGFVQVKPLRVLTQ